MIINIPNNKYDIGNLYFEILEIFKLNKVDMIIEYLDKVYLINYENDIKIFLKIYNYMLGMIFLKTFIFQNFYFFQIFLFLIFFNL